MIGDCICLSSFLSTLRYARLRLPFRWVPWASVPHLLDQFLFFLLIFGTMLSYVCHLPFSGRFAIHYRFPIPLPASVLCVPFSFGSSSGWKPPDVAEALVQPVPFLFWLLGGRIGGSPKFPSYPFRHMPWSRTPVVSCWLAFSSPGWLPSAVGMRRLSQVLFWLSFVHQYADFRGSMSRPVSLLRSVSYAHCWFCL